MNRREVAVIGRGIIGLCVAQALVEQGWRVTVIGPQALHGTASRAAVGTSNLKGNISAQNPFFALKITAHRGLEAWLDKVERQSERPIARSFVGAFEPFTHVGEYRYVRERVFHRQFTGCRDAKVVEQQWLKAHFPRHEQFTSQSLGAYHYYRDLWFDPEQCLEALEALLRRQGTLFRDDLVDAVVPQVDGGLELRLAGHGLRVSEVVLAAGIFSNQILVNSGIPGIFQEPVEGETLVAQLSDVDSLNLKVGKMNYVVHDGILRAGSSSRRQSDLSKCTPCPETATFLRQDAQKFINFDSYRTLWGVRGRFKNRMPGIGSVFFPGFPSQRLWLALGFYKNGLQLGHLFANSLASLMDNSTVLSTAFPYPVDQLRGS
jgi:glycine/D-amino acid oxidase-like deaminating enzyme